MDDSFIVSCHTESLSRARIISMAKELEASIDSLYEALCAELPFEKKERIFYARRKICHLIGLIALIIFLPLLSIGLCFIFEPNFKLDVKKSVLPLSIQKLLPILRIK